MFIVDSEKVVRKYYTNIIKLPNERFLALTSLLIVFLMYLENGLSKIFYSGIIYFLIIFLLFRDRKRLSLFLITISGATSIIFGLVGLAIYALIFFTPLYAFNLLTKYSEVRAIILSSLPSDSLIILYPYMNYLIYLIIVLLTLYLYLHSVNRKGSKSVGISSLQIARPFLKEIFHKDKNPLERFLERISYPTTVDVGVFKIGEIYAVIPKIHFGIFGRIGSSLFIYDLEDKIRNAIVFHGPGSHELDLPSRGESEKVVSEILNRLNYKNPVRLKFNSIKIYKASNFTVTSLVFDKASISFVEREDGGIDDLPQNLWDLARKYNSYIIDTHSLVKERVISLEEVNELKKEIKGLIRYYDSSNKKLLLGYSEEYLEREYQGYCNKRIRVLVFSDGEKKIGIVYLYANNAEGNLYRAIKRETKDIVDYTILVTPDDHSCTGLSFGSLYTPATLNEEVIAKVKSALKSALANLNAVNEVEFYPIEIKGVRVLGSIISVLVHGLENVGRYVMRTFWIPFILPAIVFIILITFLRTPL